MIYSAQSKTLPAIVVDANLGAGAVLAIKGLERIPELFARWAEEQRNLFAPELWRVETISVIRQHVFRKLITASQAHQAIDDLESLEVAVFSMNVALYHNALNWAGKIGQSRIYDSLYLSLAEDLNAEFWTADERLVNAARSLKIDWVKWIGDVK